MLSYATRRGVSCLGTILAVTMLSFLLIEMLPGDPARYIAGEFASPEAVERVRSDLGLDSGILERYWSFLTGALQGDLGTSTQVRAGTSVSALVMESLPVTAIVVALSLLAAVCVALPLGYSAATHAGTWWDRLVTGLTLVGLALPVFVVGLALVRLFAVNRAWFPSVGYSSWAEDGPAQWLRGLVLPSVTLAVAAGAEFTRQIRSALLHEMSEDYVQALEARGIGQRRIMHRHVFRNAAPPVVTVIGLLFARLIGGVLIVELIFGLPGVGNLLFGAVSSRDIPVMQGLVLVVGVCVIVINLVVDLVIMYLDPKVRAHA